MEESRKCTSNADCHIEDSDYCYHGQHWACDIDDELYRCFDCCSWETTCLTCMRLRQKHPHLHMFEIWKSSAMIYCCDADFQEWIDYEWVVCIRSKSTVLEELTKYRVVFVTDETKDKKRYIAYPGDLSTDHCREAVLLDLMKKYARGQAVAIRLGK
ncbi:hypothetical protein DPMN_124281 [Dreissena polymorpha]|uniref:Uncharacterized protein n=1 Tax=Dreissena polymorpha TaxID=45954 RepID=A0A9D4JSD1_DREPO|nr:hypothetical protein DPMN_124281 [Dreissena polymorpha]